MLRKLQQGLPTGSVYIGSTLIPWQAMSNTPIPPDNSVGIMQAALLLSNYFAADDNIYELGVQSRHCNLLRRI